jgi:uncharacterized heparinase superfamily protein
VATWVARGRKALRMPPRYVLGRLLDEARVQAKRPWTFVYPNVLADRTVLGDSGERSLARLWDRLAERPFFLRPADRAPWTAAYRRRFPEEPGRVIAAAERLLRHEVDLLGSGPVALGSSLPWHCDFKTGREWPIRYHRDIEYLELDRPSDVKVPWELSRAQHFTTLGRAYWLTGDESFAREFTAEVDDWIRGNPFGRGVNWACAMDVALRAVSWIWGFFFFAQADACAHAAFRERFLRSLFAHGAFVFANLETSDVNGNHYLSDGVGLVFLGELFRHADAGRRWLELGRRIVTAEIASQVTPDGVDFEASTAYHRLVLEAFLTSYLLLERHGDAVGASQWHRLGRMLDFVQAYTKPNGLAPLIGDADDGRVQKLGRQDLNDHRYLLSTGAVRLQRPDLKAAAGQFWEESFWLLGPDGAAAFDALPAGAHAAASAAFPEGGFFVLRAPSTHVIVDCGEVGMRGRGGHGHNDILGFELFLDGVNAVTDCGTYVYTASREWRNRFRSTAFHNTIHVDDEEVNRLVGEDALWQLRYDAVPDDVRWIFADDGSYWEGGHSGYRRLSGDVRPRRAIWVDATGSIVAFRDRVDGAGAHRVVWRFHLDPDCAAAIHENDCSISSSGREVWFLNGVEQPLAPRLEAGWVSRGYGVKRETQVIVVDARLSLPAQFSFLFAGTRLDGAGRRAAMEQIDLAARRASAPARG